jgi:2',3'-cyclic-nucleotide 2'-phosphodiesterase (5'-nucleotidase family)
LEFGVTQGGGQFPYMAGARYIADMTKPKGQRITSVDVLTKNGKWQPLDSGRIYSLVTNSYLASGGGGYAIFKQAKDRYDTGFMETLAFIEYVKKKKKIAPSAFTGVTYLPAK